jgi:signal peptidase I
MVKLKEKIKKLKKKYEKLEEGWRGNLLAIFWGALLAFVFFQGLSLAFNTKFPVVTVYSSSMMHKNPNVTHYNWLEKNFGYSRKFVDSWPFPAGLNVGDVAFVVKSEYEVGDVIVYKVEGYKLPVIHRIVALNEDGTFQTKGDNNIGQLSFELKVREEQIHGKVIFALPYMGYPKVALAKIVGGIKSGIL